MTPLRLQGMPLCPFAHRVRLVLAEKGLPFDAIEPASARANGLQGEAIAFGHTPVLEHNGYRVWKAAVICEYLEEAFADSSPLLPKNPVRRAHARQWIAYVDERLYPATAQLLRSPDGTARDAARERVITALTQIDQFGLAHGQSIASRAGPYWFGDRFSVIDAALLPWFEQAGALAHFRGFEWPPACSRLAPWHEAMTERAAVRAQALADEDYLGRYAQVLAR